MQVRDFERAQGQAWVMAANHSSDLSQISAEQGQAQFIENYILIKFVYTHVQNGVCSGGGGVG